MSSMKDWEQSDDDVDYLGTDEEDGKDADEEILKKSRIDYVGRRKTNSSENQALLKQEALRFVIEAPNNLAELSSMLDGRSDAEVIEAINRIRACNSIRLAAENKRKNANILRRPFAVFCSIIYSKTIKC